MKFISLCSGIEAASVAFKSLGWSAIAFSEIDAFPSAVLAHHYPSVPNLGDMTKFKSWPEQIFIDADAIVGGPPCQAFSVAGKRASLDDERGNLTLIYTELIDHADRIRISHGRPAVVCLYENVPGILSTKDNAFGCFLAQLCGGDEPLNAPDGWPNAGCVSGPSRTAAWRVLDAQYFGLPQRRRRVFVVASARNDFDPAGVLFELEGVRRDFAPSRGAREEIAGTITASSGGSDENDAADGRLVASGVERAGDARGQDPVIAVPEICGTMKACKDSGGWSNSADHAAAGYMIPVRTLCVATGQASAEIGAEIAPTLNCNHEAPYIAKPTFAAAFKGGQGSAAGSIGYSEHVAPTLSSADSGSNRTPVVLTHAQHVPCIAFPERLSGTQCASTADLSPSLGALNPMAVAFGVRDVSPTITSNYGKNADSSDTALGPNVVMQPVAYTTKLHNTKSNNAGKISEERTVALDANSPPPALLTVIQVRRLTVRECERLQGFQFRVTPDCPGAWQDAPGEWWSPDYTLIPFGARKKISKSKLAYLRQTNQELRTEDAEKLAADGPRYKALGNSWAIPCVAWIGDRINQQLTRGSNG